MESFENNKELDKIGDEVKNLVENNMLEQCEELLHKIIGRFPHAPEPHNWYGILLEKEGAHIQAMKHLRAAWALDPTYLPARYNMEQYGEVCCGIFRSYKSAYTLKDCPELMLSNKKIRRQGRLEDGK